MLSQRVPGSVPAAASGKDGNARALQLHPAGCKPFSLQAKPYCSTSLSALKPSQQLCFGSRTACTRRSARSTLATTAASGCPFGFDKGDPDRSEPSIPDATSLSALHQLVVLQEDSLQQPAAGPVVANILAKRRRVVTLYEEYIHLHWLKQVWDAPVTERPQLEPCFAAAVHGIELSFLLLAEFLGDERRYVAKRPRVEQVAHDIRTQCTLLTEIIDGELEEEGATSALTLTQAFPFAACPPTVGHQAHSPSLQCLINGVSASLARMSTAETNSLVKVVHHVTTAFAGAFSRWTVGLGIEPQLNELRVAVGLGELAELKAKPRNLDYELLVRPQLVAQTRTGEAYSHKEDFFFRTVHLGSEAWALVATQRIMSAKQYASEGQWHLAAARALQAARILNYLGDHVLMLTSMNLRDYLLLKVELEGTSGEGSRQVKAFRPHVRALLAPLASGLLANQGAPSCAKPAPVPSAPPPSALAEQLHAALMGVYEDPDSAPGLYSYARALEELEAALLGGFYYKHFRLAASVIGSAAQGTMGELGQSASVAGLKATYERAVFPELDAARAALGAKMDLQLAHLKGRMLDDIEAKRAAKMASLPRGRCA